MPYIEIFALAVALAMDALAVAVATGIKLRCTPGQILRMSLAFGAFQFIMPVIGWTLGLTVRGHIETFDHWVAFGLLAFVGTRMARQGMRDEDAEDECPDPTRGMTLLLLALATSIDALAVGISISVLGVSIWQPAAIIGLVCFCFTAAGMRLGRAAGRLGPALGRKANIIGGIMLVAIGVKIVVEHLG